MLVASNGMFYCASCGERKSREAAARDSTRLCKRCEYLTTLVKAARAREKGEPATITVETFIKDTHCQLTGLPLSFGSLKKRDDLCQATLDRLDSYEGYTVENTRLRCAGINYAKGGMTEEQFSEFLMSVGQGRKAPVV